MSNPSTFWKRVGSAFRLGGDGNLTPTTPSTVLMTREFRDVGRLSGEDGGGGAFSNFFPWQSRRRREAAELRERQICVMEQLAAMKVHFQVQDQRAEQLNAAVQRVAGTLEQLASSQSAQAHSIATIAQHAETSVRQGASLLATTVELPASLQAQAEAVRAVSRRMEASQATDAQLVASLQQFGRSVEELHRAGALQVETLRGLHSADDRHQEQFRALIKAQNRRLYWICGLIVAAFALSTAGLIAALAFGWIRVP
ncbi:MAG: hypothetical protein HZB38_10325 [Planctomycetes bacterium]|nr:hypothetical protein [Planctomycetota bacterium]